MRARTVVLSFALIVAGAIGGAMLAPPAADAVSREIIELQQSVAQILQNQQDLRSNMDSKFASLQTLIQQSSDATTHLSLAVGSMQKAFQDAQANSGASNSSVTQQMTGISDNMADMQARVAKLSQQLADIQSTLQTINAKVSAPAPTQAAPTSQGTGGDAPGSTQPAGGGQPTATNQPASSLQPEGIAGRQPELWPAEDVQRAKQLLAEAGYPDGRGFPELSFTYRTSDEWKLLAQ